MALTLVFAALFMSAAMCLAWAIQRRTGNSGWIDTIWSFAVALASIGAAFSLGGASGRAWLAAALIGAWGLRLGGYIAFRSKGAPEDPRYAALVAEWGADASRRLFMFLQAQAIAGFVLVVCVGLAARNPAPLWRWLDVLALAVFAGAIAGAAMADEQLRRFRGDAANRGKVCDAGLWGLSRHPNYFFEWMGWLAYPLLALGALQPWGFLAFAAPALMYVLLVHVSGIPPLEEHMERSRGDAFRAYRARVNAFFPGLPTSSRS